MLYYYRLNPRGLKLIEAAKAKAQSKPVTDPNFKNRHAFLNYLLEKPLFDPYSFYLTEKKYKEDDVMGKIIKSFTKLTLQTGSSADEIAPEKKSKDLRMQVLKANYQKKAKI